jgi:hypothetical protein
LAKVVAEETHHKLETECLAHRVDSTVAVVAVVARQLMVLATLVLAEMELLEL